MEKKSIKISLSTFFLIIAIIIIIIMGIFMFFQQVESKKEITELENQTNKLQNTITTLQEEIEQVDNSKKEETSDNIINSQNASNDTSNASEVTKKQTLNASGYDITLYSDGKAEIIPLINDIKTIWGDSTTIKGEGKSYNVIGTSGKIEKMFQGNTGGGVNPITFFIMEDGTVQYIQPLVQIMNNNNTIPNSFKIDGKINNVSNVVNIKSDSSDVIIAITRDGKEVKIWNE